MRAPKTGLGADKAVVVRAAGRNPKEKAYCKFQFAELVASFHPSPRRPFLMAGSEVTVHAVIEPYVHETRHDHQTALPARCLNPRGRAAPVNVTRELVLSIQVEHRLL